MTEWQDISTAPKDGTVILLWWDGDFAPLGFWRDNSWQFNMAQAWPVGISEQITDAFLRFDPTHWMPLPEPPQ